jgi:protein required for attachment to host cells
MRIQIVVASQAEATFYDVQHIDDKLQIMGQLSDSLARLHDRDFKSDRPGRVFDYGRLAGGRRGATARHGTGGRESPRKHEAAIFAQKIATQLEHAWRAGGFERLIVMAEANFLGILRRALPTSLSSATIVVAEDFR